MHIGFVHLKLGAHRRDFKQAEPFRQSNAGLWQVQQKLQRLHQGHLPGRGIGYRKRNVPWMLRWKTTKHGLNVGGKRGHVGHHHHHIGRLPCGVVIKPIPKPIMQNFYFALSRMRLDHLNAAIVVQRFWNVGHRIQSEDVGLDFLQACGISLRS